MIQEPFMFVLLSATLLMLFVSYLSFRKRRLAVARYNGLSMLAAALYSFGYAFETISLDMESILFWLRVQYIGIPFISTLWLLFVIHYTGYQSYLKRWMYALLFLIPVMTVILHFTNESHHLFYSSVTLNLDSGSLSPVKITRGPWYWVHIAYTYFQGAAGIGLFVAAYVQAMPIVRKQTLLLIMVATAPWVCNLIYVIRMDLVLIDLTALGFLLSGIVQIWGIYRFHLLRLTPVALQSVYDTMQDGVIILDYEDGITQVNNAAKSMFKELRFIKENEASVGCVLRSQPELAAFIRRPGNHEGTVSLEHRGEMRHYSLRISALHDRSGEMLGRMVILSDTTQMTAYQEKLLASANQMAEMSAFKDKLFTLVAHDLRDPLAVLINLTELLEKEIRTTGEEQEILREVGGHVRHTYRLMENLLEWYRSQTGKAVYRPSEWNLTASLEETIRTMKLRADTKGVAITSELAGDNPVYADREMLELVLRNLISNAVKFTPEGGAVQVGATKEGEGYAIYVRDTGVGIHPGAGQSLFKDVQTGASQGTDGEAGSGLGLYLSANLVALHGGNIWYESVKDEGSTFYFTVPARAAEEESVMGRMSAPARR